MHAVRGRSAHHEDIFGSVGYRKRFIERERIARAAVVMLGRYDGNAAESAHFVGQCIDAGRHVAVVIADENMHASNRPFGGLFLRKRHCTENRAEAVRHTFQVARSVKRLAARFGHGQHFDAFFDKLLSLPKRTLSFDQTPS